MPAVKEKETQDGEPKPRKRPGRVPVSCAECRRLKLRCDRKVPCETCVKRGCAALCPDGQLITGGKGTRQAVADVEDLKRKIADLQERNKALENALRSVQAHVTDDQHPLLQNGAEGSTSSSSASPADSSSSSNGSAPEVSSLTSEEADILDAFGTLTLGLRGESRFFGQTSRSEYLIHAPEKQKGMCCADLKLPRLSKLLVEEASKELDVRLENVELAQEMLGLLPPLSQATQMCETFLEFGKFAWYPLSREVIFDDIIAIVYNNPHKNCNVTLLHSISLLWMIYALATLYDQNSPPYSVDGQEYYLLARASLRLAPPANETTLIAIQTMIYMAQYLELGDREPAHTASHKAWMVIGQAVKLGHSIGLHVSSSRWRLDEEATNERNRVFWQLFYQDTWLSYGFGRPPSINLDFVDCEMPKEPEIGSGDQDMREAGFHLWTWQYTKVLHSVMSTAFGVKQPGYAKLMELDRRIRDFPVPASLRVQCGIPEETSPTMALTMQRVIATQLKEATLMNLHRPYFSQALNDMPRDPLRHKYGPSVMAIYRSAWRIFACSKCAFKAVPGVLSRMSFTWSLALSGSIVMCLLVVRAPTSNLAKASLAELDKIGDLFEEAAKQSQIASNNLAVMKKLRKQAHDALNNAHADGESELIHNELDRLGGKTHLIRDTEETARPCNRVNPANGRSPGSTSACEPPVQPEMIHPTIMRDMHAFDVGIWDGRLPEVNMNDANFNLDFPSNAFPNPQQVEYPPFPDFDFMSAPDVGMASTTSAPASSAAPVISTADPWAHPMQAALNPPPGVPVLDASWQALVEQLGF